MGKIHFILTGGTIDSKTTGRKRDIVFNHSIVPGYLKSLKLHSDIKFTEICMKDSRDITDDDRKKILKAIESQNCNKTVVTHGTFTMVDTARYIKNNLKITGLTVVLTGAMMPLNFKNTDAPFNLGFALSAVENLKPGVYIAMNGRVFLAHDAVKDEQNGRFVLEALNK